jgi:hypothetical protein
METDWTGSSHESLQGAITELLGRRRQREMKKNRKFVRRDVSSMRAKHGIFQIKHSPMTKLYSIQCMKVAQKVMPNIIFSHSRIKIAM